MHHWGYYTSLDASPRETLCLEELDRCKNAALEDANACSTFHVHFGHPTSANPQGDAVFARAGKSVKTCRLLGDFASRVCEKKY